MIFAKYVPNEFLSIDIQTHTRENTEGYIIRFISMYGINSASLCYIFTNMIQQTILLTPRLRMKV